MIFRKNGQTIEIQSPKIDEMTRENKFTLENVTSYHPETITFIFKALIEDEEDDEYVTVKIKATYDLDDALISLEVVDKSIEKLFYKNFKSKDFEDLRIM